MNKEEFKEKVLKENLNAVKFNVDYHPMQDDETGLLRTEGRYAVYQSFERGGYRTVEVFDSEEDALESIISYLRIMKKGEDHRKNR